MRNPFPILFVVFLSSCTSIQKDSAKSKTLESTTSHASSISPNLSNKGGVDYFVSDVYGPFYVGDPDFDATFSYRASIENQQIIESFQVFPVSSQDPYVTTNHPPFYYRNNSLIETTFTVPIKRYLTNKGLILKFEILSSPSREVLKSYSTILYPCTQPGWSLEALKTGYCFTRNIGFYGSGKALTPVTETFDFHYLGDYIDNEYYYRLDLQNNYVKYESMFDFSYGTINLKIEDKENLFTYFNHDSDGNIIIPLKATLEKNETVTFSIKNTLYVNPITLEMSDSKQTGFNKTKDFYFPVNKQDKFNNLNVNLELISFGKCKLDATFPLQYMAGKPLVGKSGNSHYFVVGGVK